MIVELLQTSDSSQNAICSYEFKNGKIEFEGKDNIRSRIENSGVLMNGKVYREKHGEKFLKALLAQFTGSYLRATVKRA